MKTVVGLGITGPFKNEQQFKMKFIEKSTERGAFGDKYFCIETEETEPGFPDVMKLTYENKASFFEMKLADSEDNFKVQRTQPLFYLNHRDLDITILVWSNKRNKMYAVTSEEVISRVLGAEGQTLNLNDFREE